MQKTDNRHENLKVAAFAWLIVAGVCAVVANVLAASLI